MKERLATMPALYATGAAFPVLSIILALIFSLAVGAHASLESFAEAFKSHSPYKCPETYEISRDAKVARGLKEYASDQERFIDALNGKKIVFIGDSITRYQYLELAAFLTQGRCLNETDPGKYGYFLSHKPYSSWHEFYTKSSDALNIQSAFLTTREVCLCARIKLEPGYATEHRTFSYRDSMVCTLIQKGKPERAIIFTVENQRPTDIVMNYGMWLSDTKKTCGRGKAYFKNDNCPHTKSVCHFLKEHKHPFRTFWMTTTPVNRKGKVRDPLGEGHHLNIPKTCGLNSTQVVDRMSIVHELEPDREKKLGLWWDPVHFHAQASHAFNGLLVEKILEAEVVETQAHTARVAKVRQKRLQKQKAEHLKHPKNSKKNAHHKH